MNTATPENDSLSLQSLSELRSAIDSDKGYRKATLGIDPGSLLDTPVLRHRVRSGQDSLLQRLFLLGDEIRLTDLTADLGSTCVSSLQSLGLLEVNGDAVAATAMIIPFRGVLVVSDFPKQEESPGEEPLYTPGSDSERLFDLRIDAPNGRVLDLCTGTGVQAFGAAATAASVTCVDINPRAIWATSLGAKLNRLGNIEVIAGDLTQPVADRSFDRVLANPPFVTAPSKKTLYRDGGRFGTDVVERLLSEVPGILSHDGICQIVTHLYQFSDRDIESWLQESTQANRLDMIVLRGSPFSAHQLVVGQLRTRVLNFQQYTRESTRYLEYLNELGFEFGYMALVSFRIGSGTFKVSTFDRTVAFGGAAATTLNRFFSF